MVNKLLTICKKGRKYMRAKRKTCNERQLIDLIHKTFTVFCKANKCNKCIYRYSECCEVDYVAELILKDKKES